MDLYRIALKYFVSGLLSMFCTLTFGQTNGTITLLVGYPAGGGTDMMARHLALRLQKTLGQTVVVQNMPGAGSRIATQTLIRSPSDGLKLLVATSDITLNQALRKEAPWDVQKDFTHLAIVAQSPVVYAVNNRLPVKSLREFFDYVRSRQKGQEVSAGSGGVTKAFLAELSFKQKLNMLEVPYKGVAPMLQDLTAGLIDFGIMNPAQIPGREERIRALAVTGNARHPLVPNMPTTAEAGFPELSASTFIEVLGPPKMPAEVATRIARALDEVAGSDEFKKDMIASGAGAMFVGGKDLLPYIEADLKRWQEVRRTQGVLLDD